MLDIDWASLVDSTKNKTPANVSALKRFQPGAVLAKLGIAQQYLNPGLTNKVLTICQQHHEDEATQAGRYCLYSSTLNIVPVLVSCNTL